MNPQIWLSGVVKDPETKPTSLAVAVSLWSFMDRHGRCFPGVAAIGDRAGIRKRDTVRAALSQLEELGHLEISLQPRGRLSTNEYRAVDNSARPPAKRVTAVTRLTDRRPPAKRVTQGPPRNGSRTIPIRTRGGTGADVVDNEHHPMVMYLAETTRMP